MLTGHIAATLDAGRPLPAPRDPAALEKDAAVKAEWDEAHAFVMLRAIMPAGRTRRVNISLDEAVLSLVDDEAGKRGLSRSGFIAEACRRMAAGDQAEEAQRNFARRMEMEAAQMAGVLHEAAGTVGHLGVGAKVGLSSVRSPAVSYGGGPMIDVEDGRIVSGEGKRAAKPRKTKV